MASFTKCMMIGIVLVLMTPLSWTSVANGQQADEKTKIDEKTVRKLIAALGDESFEKREAADKALLEIGKPALPLLRKAVADATDLEIRDRAHRLIRTIGAGPGPSVLYPEAFVLEIAIAKDNQTMAVGCGDKVIRVYDLKTAALRHTLRGHTGGVWSVAISADGQTLASCSGEYGNSADNGEIIIWDLAKGTASKTLKGHQGIAFGLVFSPDGKRLYSCGWDETVRVWDSASGKEVAVLHGHSGPVRRVHCTADGKFIVSCGFDSAARFWNCETLREERKLVTSHDGIASSAISPDGKWFITGSRPSTAPDPGVITVWDVATGKEKATLKGPTRKVNGMAVSPDSRLLAMGGGFNNQFGEVKIFDIASGKELAAFHDHQEWVGGLTFSPDGRWLVSGSGFTTGRPGEIRFWDMTSLRAKGE